LSCEVVHEKLCKSVNICNSYTAKNLVAPFLCGHRVYEFAMVCDCVGAADCSWLLYICTPIVVSDNWEAPNMWRP